MLAHLHLRL